MLFYEEHFYGISESDLWKRPKNHSFHNIHTCMYGSQTFWSFMKLYFVHIVKVSRLELRVRDSWIMNQFLDPTNKKFVKRPFFTNHFFPKYENFKVFSADGVKWDWTKILKNSLETPVLSPILITSLQLYKKRHSGTYVFLWILLNFQEQLFHRTLTNGYLYVSLFFASQH